MTLNGDVIWNQFDLEIAEHGHGRHEEPTPNIAALAITQQTLDGHYYLFVTHYKISVLKITQSVILLVSLSHSYEIESYCVSRTCQVFQLFYS